MNLTEIKNATREELIDYLQMYGNELSHDHPIRLTRLRDAALQLYWKNKQNNGYSFESVVGGNY